MTKIVASNTSTEEWHKLVKEGQTARAIYLGEELESYLVFLLMRFTNQPGFSSSVLALEWLNSHRLGGQEQILQLQTIGDKCLLFSGFFPGRAEQKRVKISYFVDLGQSAYAKLSFAHQRKTAKLYSKLSDNFVLLLETLQSIREVSKPNQMSPMQAFDLWLEANSQKAFGDIQEISKGALPVNGTNKLPC